MESFTIKYDMDDLPMRNTDEHSDSIENANNNSSSSSSNHRHCICHRMARLFSDLLVNNSTTNTSNNKSSRNNGSYDEDPDTLNSLTSIHREMKLLRKYQFDLDAKFNLLLAKLTYSQQAAASLTAAMTNNKKPQQQYQPAINNLLQQNQQQEQQQQQHQPVRMSNGRNTTNTSSSKSLNNNISGSSTSSTGSSNKIAIMGHQSLTGAKKRKFNSNNSTGLVRHRDSIEILFFLA